jgi:hypothetical protein
MRAVSVRKAHEIVLCQLETSLDRQVGRLGVATTGCAFGYAMPLQSKLKPTCAPASSGASRNRLRNREGKNVSCT